MLAYACAGKEVAYLKGGTVYTFGVQNCWTCDFVAIGSFFV